MKQSYEDLRQLFIATMNARPDTEGSLSELAALAVKESRRHGGGGILDLYLITLSKYIDNERTQQMKTSDLDKAKNLQRHAQFYERLLNKLSDYPGYDATLVIDGEELMISRAQAREIIEHYQEKNNAEMAALGLEFDE